MFIYIYIYIYIYLFIYYLIVCQKIVPYLCDCIETYFVMVVKFLQVKSSFSFQLIFYGGFIEIGRANLNFNITHTTDIISITYFKSWWFIDVWCVLICNIGWFLCIYCFQFGGITFIIIVSDLFHLVLPTIHMLFKVWYIILDMWVEWYRGIVLVYCLYRVCHFEICLGYLQKCTNHMELYVIWHSLELLSKNWFTHFIQYLVVLMNISLYRCWVYKRC